MLRRGIPLAAVVIAAALVMVVATADPGRTPVVSSPSSAAASPSPASPSAQPVSQSPQATSQTPRAGAWTELQWSAPSPIPEQAGFLDVVSWHDGYVAAADVAGPDGHVGAAFTSPDGVRWQRTATFPANPSIVATATGLVAVVNRLGPPPSVEAWISVDGRSWQRQERLALAGATITKLVARDGTIVAAGIDANGRTMLWASADGAQWSQGQSPAPRAIVRSVATVGDGFLAVGRDGEPDVASGGVGVRGVGRPAAWRSADGRTWSAVQVEGVDAAGAELIGVFRVADGFFAVGSDSNVNQRAALLWASIDPRDWRLVGPPPHWGLASANGQQAVVFSAADFGTVALGAWASLDGRDWTQLSFGGDVARMPAFEVAVGQSSRVERILVVSRGVVVIGQQNGQPTAWFAEAVPR